MKNIFILFFDSFHFQEVFSIMFITVRHDLDLGRLAHRVPVAAVAHVHELPTPRRAALRRRRSRARAVRLRRPPRARAAYGDEPFSNGYRRQLSTVKYDDDLFMAFIDSSARGRGWLLYIFSHQQPPSFPRPR